MDFLNKTVIVTGAAKGIGRGIALAYAKHGANVVLADIEEEAGIRLETTIKMSDGEATFVKTDVRSEKDIIHLVQETYNIYGRLDILVNNAGINGFEDLFKLTVEDWDNVINTNLRSVFLCSREAAKVMKYKPEGGAIVNIASTRALMSEPNSESYAATKGGILALTHALASSLSEFRIRVNAISPGWIETGDYNKLSLKDHHQHLSRRVGRPEDIARACLYLTDEGNDFVTGENIVIDGGMTKKMIYEE